MEKLIDQIQEHLAEVEAFQSNDPTEIENFRIKFLGKKGILAGFLHPLRRFPTIKKRPLANV